MKNINIDEITKQTEELKQAITVLTEYINTAKKLQKLSKEFETIKKEEQVKEVKAVKETKPVEEVKEVKTKTKRISAVERYNLITIDPTTPEHFTKLLTNAGIFNSKGNYMYNKLEIKYIGVYQLNNNTLAFKLYNANEAKPKKVLKKHYKNNIEIFPYSLYLNKKNVKEEALNAFKAFVNQCLPAVEEKKEEQLAA